MSPSSAITERRLWCDTRRPLIDFRCPFVPFRPESGEIFDDIAKGLSVSGINSLWRGKSGSRSRILSQPKPRVFEHIEGAKPIKSQICQSDALLDCHQKVQSLFIPSRRRCERGAISAIVSWVSHPMTTEELDIIGR